MGLLDNIKSALARPSDTLPTTPMPRQDHQQESGGLDPFGGNLPVYMGGLQSVGFNPGHVQLWSSEQQGQMVARCEQIEQLTQKQMEVYDSLERVIDSDTALHGRQMQTATHAVNAMAQQQQAAGEVKLAAIQAGLGLVGIENRVKQANRFRSGYAKQMLGGG